MHLINVICSNCGTLLSIPEEVKHATCNGCAMPFSVKQTDTITFIEPMLLSRPDNLAIVPVERIDSFPEIEEKRSLSTIDKSFSSEPEELRLVTNKPQTPSSIRANSIVLGEIAALDKDWIERKARMGRAGILPTEKRVINAWIGGIAGVIVGFVILRFDGVYSLFGLVLMFVSMIMSFLTTYDTSEYFARKKEYKRQRLLLVSQLNQR